MPESTVNLAGQLEFDKISRASESQAQSQNNLNPNIKRAQIGRLPDRKGNRKWWLKLKNLKIELLGFD